MDAYEKTELLVNISKMYYEHGLSQQEIAKKAGISRTYISKLLQEARDVGIVEIRINDPLKKEAPLERLLRTRLGIAKAIIIPAKNGDAALREKLGVAAAEYLHLILKDGDILGVAWGKTLHALAKAVAARGGLKDVRVVQVCGGVSRMQENVYTSDIPRDIAHSLQAAYSVIPLPAVLPSAAAMEAVMQDKNTAEALETARRADVAVFTAGVWQPDNVFVRAGYFAGEEISRLRQAGAVGDICSHIIDGNGKLCDRELDARTVAVPLDDIKAIPTHVCVAAGKGKAASIRAAAVSGCIGTLVTNEETAQSLLVLFPE